MDKRISIFFITIGLVLVLFGHTHGSHPKNNFVENAFSKWHQQHQEKSLQQQQQSQQSDEKLEEKSDPVMCTCGVFLTGQFKKGQQPTGNPVLLNEHDILFPCSIAGNKQCINKCLETIVKYLPNSSALVCGGLDRDCHKERAYLFIQNCNSTWVNTNLSAGREYCCKDSVSYKCPLV